MTIFRSRSLRASIPRLVGESALVAVLLAGLSARALGQLPPAPQPTLGPPGSCPADAHFDFDVSSVTGANRIRWQLRRGTPGQPFVNATDEDDGVKIGTKESVERDLREFGRVLDGTRYFFRVRARQGGDNLTEFSEPVVFELDLSPNGMFTAGPGTDPLSLRVDWNLADEIGDCADRVAVRIDKVNGSATVQSVETGDSGTRTYDLAAHGPGDYVIRLHARFQGGGPEDAVGRESDTLRVTVQALEPREESAVALSIAVKSFQLQGGASTVAVSTPITLNAVTSGATPSQYKAALCGADFTAAAFQPLPATGPPVLPGFAIAGTRNVCFQVRSGLTSSATVSDAIEVVAPLTRFNPGDVTAISSALTPVSISSFQLQGGAPFVTVGKIVSLDVTATGNPTEFRSGSTIYLYAGCQFGAWQAFSASTPPTLSFGSPVPHKVCIQLRRGSQTSSVADDEIGVARSSWGSVIMGKGGYRIGIPDCQEKFAVGVDVRMGWWIDALALQCAELTATGDHYNYSGTPLVGGEGGARETRMCRSGTVLFGLIVEYGEYVHRLRLYCIAWSPDLGSHGSHELRDPIGGSTSGDREEWERCPIPLAVTSIEVFGGEFVTGVRFHCTPPPDM